MPIKYVPFIPEPVEGQAVLGNFNRILRYKGADEVSMTLQRGMPLYEMEKQETVGENAVLKGEAPVVKINDYKAVQADNRYYKIGLASIGGVSGGMAVLGIVIMILAGNLAEIITTLVSSLL